MKFHIFIFFVIIILFTAHLTVSAQADTVLGQITSSNFESFAGGISGDSRFIVFESAGNLATENPRNTDGNREIFLFDYAQRRIFQITDTKSLLTDTTKSPTFDNVKVDIVNVRPVISNDGKWLAFSSNATCSYPGNGTIAAITSSTNPGSFDPNATSSNPCLVGSGTTQTNNLVNDGNTEMWIYQIPSAATVTDLTVGDEIPVTNLAGGTFTRLTNTLPSRPPIAGSANNLAIIADDNHDSSIDDTGAAISFTSNRDLVPCTATASATCGNAATQFDNDEIYTYIRSLNTIKQVTSTSRGTIGNPIYNANSTITNLLSGGWRISFLSNANNAITGMSSGGNSDNNEEVYYADLDASGAIATRKQVTATTRTTAGDIVNILNYGRRISRDGRYISFDSYADLSGNSTNQVGFATFLYDTNTSTFRQIGVRSDADSGANGGDIQRYPGFSDYDSNRTPQTIVLTTRLNIKADGTIPATATDGLNNDVNRPAQLYTFPITGTVAFTRISKLPTPVGSLASIQALPSNSARRISFNLANTEPGTGNFDLASEVFYLVTPAVVSTSTATYALSTGASKIPVSASPVPTPTPGTTPTPTPTPTPQTPAAVYGVSPGMLAILDLDSTATQPIVVRTAVGSLNRRPTLPFELSGVTMTINGIACGLKQVGTRQITFVVPPGLSAADAGTVYPLLVNSNGVVYKGSVTLVQTRPDIFTKSAIPGPGGRAKIVNSTNRILTGEPFTIKTFKLHGSRRVASILRLYLTGVNNVPASLVTIRIGSTTITNIITDAVLVEPGVYTIDFRLPPELAKAGDQPIILTVTINGVMYQTRLDDTAPRLFII